METLPRIYSDSFGAAGSTMFDRPVIAKLGVGEAGKQWIWTSIRPSPMLEKRTTTSSRKPLRSDKSDGIRG